MKLPSGALEESSFMIISPAVVAKNTQRTLIDNQSRVLFFTSCKITKPFPRFSNDR